VVPPADAIATTSIFFFTQDFDLTNNLQVPEDFLVTAYSGIDAIELTGAPNSTIYLQRRKYKAGEIIETDIALAQDADWHLFPEDEDDLLDQTGMSREQIRGMVDIQAVFTREIGHALGLTSSQLQRPVMSATYRTGNTYRTRTDPYEARELHLDDKVTLMKLYPGSGYGNLPGISGEVRDGATFTPNSGDATVVPLIPDVPVFFGRPVPFNSVYVYDGLDIVQEKDEGFVLLEAMTFSGEKMVVPAASGDFDFSGVPGFTDIPDLTLLQFMGATFNGNYSIRGLPRASNWYVYVKDPDPDITYQIGNRDMFGQFGEAPAEFFGGANPNRPKPGDGNAIDDSDPTNGIESRFIRIFVIPLYTDPLTGVYRATGQFAIAPNGFAGYTEQPDAVIVDDGAFNSIAVSRAQADPTNPMATRYYNNRGRSYGPLLADGNIPGIATVDDIFNRATISETIPDVTGTGMLALDTEFKVGKFPGDPLPRTVTLTWTLTNLTSERLDVQFAQGYEIGKLLVTPAVTTGLVADGEPIIYETGYGSGFTTPLPTYLATVDIISSPSLEGRFMLQGGSLTPPTNAIAGVWTDMVRTNLFQYTPRNRIIINPINTPDTVSPDLSTLGIILRWGPITLDPATNPQVTISTAVTVIRHDSGLADYDGTVIREDVDSLYDDDPTDGKPLNLSQGQMVEGAIIYTNTATRPDPFFAEDYDGDGVPNDSDNCPWVPNEDQDENDLTTPRGTVCVQDFDADGIDDALDNCPAWPNTDQNDTDDDGKGDVCDDDIDGDGVPNCYMILGHDLGWPEFYDPNSLCNQDLNGDGVADPQPEDNCPFIPNPDQRDSVGDGTGDACRGDYDGDGVLDDADNCPGTPNPNQEDLDKDGIGDACDNDIDGDGVPNDIDNCPEVYNPATGEPPTQPDADGDGIGDACEAAGTTISVDEGALPSKDWFVNGAAFGDVNGDGWVDLVLAIGGFGNFTNAALANRILINQGYLGKPGVFRDETYGLNGRVDGTPFYNEPGQQFTGDDRLPLNFENTWDVKLADFDLDGDLDILFSNYSGVTVTQGNVWGAPDRILINRDINDPAVNPRVDNDDLGDGFFTDASDICMPGILNTKNMVGPNPIAYMTLGDAYGQVDPYTTRSDIEDIDCDGDPDIVLSVFDDLNSGAFGLNLGGFPDLAGSIARYIGDDNLVHNRYNENLHFSEMILVNRRNELKFASGQVIPRGTPDAFFVFLSQSIDVRRAAGFSPDPDPDDYLMWNSWQTVGDMSMLLNSTSWRNIYGSSPYLGRRLDAFMFRDDTLGRDGVFGGTLRRRPVPSTGPVPQVESTTTYNIRNLDRMPPQMGDFPETTPGVGNVETDFSIPSEVIRWQIVGDSGADLFVANRFFPRGTYDPQYKCEGFDFFYWNTDVFSATNVFGTDGLADGYFSELQFGTDSLYQRITQALNDAIRVTDFTIPDGYPGDLQSPEEDYIPWRSNIRRDNTMGACVADFDNQGMVRVLTYTDAGPNPIYDPDSSATSYRGGPFFGRGQTGSVYGYAREFLADVNNADSRLYYAQDMLPARTGRTLHGTVADLNMDGLPDVIFAQDGVGVNLYQVNNTLGTQQIIFNGGFCEPDSWTDASQTSLNPNTPVRAAFVAAADVDNDGDQDIFLGMFGRPSLMFKNEFYQPRPRLDQAANNASYVNRVDLTSDKDQPIFYDMTLVNLPAHAMQSAGEGPTIKQMSNVTMAVHSADVDRDGDMDLFFFNGGDFTENGDNSFLFLNHGLSLHPYATRVFHPTGRGAPAPRLLSWGWPNTYFEQSLRPAYDGFFFDYDLDGDLDLYIAYNGTRNRLFENRDAKDPLIFQDYPSQTGLSRPTEARSYNTFTNYDTDPRDHTSYAARCFNNDLGDGIFDDVTDRRLPSTFGQPQNRLTSKRPAGGDLNCDGYPDIVVANSFADAGGPNLLFLNPISTSATPSNVDFIDATETKFPTTTLTGPGNVVDGLQDNTVQALVADFNQDGLPDVFFVNQCSQDSEVEIPGSSTYNPDFVWWSRLLANQGFNSATGEWNGCADVADFVTGFVQKSRSDMVFHRLLEGAKVCDINQDGDFCEDFDGNGIVTDEEILEFENLIESLNYRGASDPSSVDTLFHVAIRDTFNDAKIKYINGINGDGNIDANEYLAVSSALAQCVTPLPTGSSPSATSPFVMDGTLDAAAWDFGDGLFVAERQGWLYVACNSGNDLQDVMILVSSDPSTPVAAPMSKSGTVGRYDFCLWREGSNNTDHSWYNAAGAALPDDPAQYAHFRSTTTGFIEGTIRKNLLGAGQTAFVAAGTYWSNNSGELVRLGPMKRPPVDQLITQSRLAQISRPEVPHGTVQDLADVQVLWRRKARWIDRDNDGKFEPSYDVVITAVDQIGQVLGQPIVLLNNRNRTTNAAAQPFRAGVNVLPAIIHATFNVDIGDIDLDGRPDIIMGRGTDITEKSVVVLHNRTTNEANPTFTDVTSVEYPDIVTTTFYADWADPSGNSRAVQLTDIDGDGDLDLVVGNAGRFFGSQWFGAPNQVLYNRIRGASWSSRTGIANARVAGSSGPIINPDLSITVVSPGFAPRGTKAMEVRIYGTNFKYGARAYMGDGVQIVSGPVVRSSQVIELKVTVDTSAIPGPRSVSVFNPDGETARSTEAFLVTARDATQDYGPLLSSNPMWEIYE